MSEKRKFKKYDESFKEETIKLVLEQGLSISQAARDLGLSPSTLHSWIKKTKLPLPQNSNSSGNKAQDPKIIELEKQVKRLTMEREILKKAMAFFVDLPK